MFFAALITTSLGSTGYTTSPNYFLLWNDDSLAPWIQSEIISGDAPLQTALRKTYQICPPITPTQHYPVALLMDHTNFIRKIDFIEPQLSFLFEEASVGNPQIAIAYIKKRYDWYQKNAAQVNSLLQEPDNQKDIESCVRNQFALEGELVTPNKAGILREDLPIEAYLVIDPKTEKCTVSFGQYTEIPIQICLKKSLDGQPKIQAEVYPWYRVPGGADIEIGGKLNYFQGYSYLNWIDLFASWNRYDGLKLLENEPFFEELRAHIDDPLPKAYEYGRSTGTALYRAILSASPRCVFWLLNHGADPNLIIGEREKQGSFPLIFTRLKDTSPEHPHGFYSSDKRCCLTMWFDFRDAQNRILQLFCSCPSTKLQLPMIRIKKTSNPEEKAQAAPQEKNEQTKEMQKEQVATRDLEEVSLLQYCIELGRSDLVWILALDYCFKQYFEKLEGTNHANFSHESIGKLVKFTNQLFKSCKDPKLAQTYIEILMILSQISIKQTPYNLFMELRKKITKPDHTLYPHIKDLEVIYARSFLANILGTSFEKLFQHLLKDCGLQEVEARDLSIRIWREQYPEDSVQKLAESIGLPFKDPNQSSFFGKMKGFFGKKS